jgi:hypothetical protein
MIFTHSNLACSRFGNKSARRWFLKTSVSATNSPFCRDDGTKSFAAHFSKQLFAYVLVLQLEVHGRPLKCQLVFDDANLSEQHSCERLIAVELGRQRPVCPATRMRDRYPCAVNGEMLTLRAIALADSLFSQCNLRSHADLLPIADDLVPYLKEAIEASPSELVFPAPDGRRQRHDIKLQNIPRKALAKAGIVIGFDYQCRPHHLRSAFGAPHRTRAPHIPATSPRRRAVIQ